MICAGPDSICRNGTINKASLFHGVWVGGETGEGRRVDMSNKEEQCISV